MTMSAMSSCNLRSMRTFACTRSRRDFLREICNIYTNKLFNCCRISRSCTHKNHDWTFFAAHFHALNISSQLTFVYRCWIRENPQITLGSRENSWLLAIKDWSLFFVMRNMRIIVMSIRWFEGSYTVSGKSSKFTVQQLYTLSPLSIPNRYMMFVYSIAEIIKFFSTVLF